MTARNPRILIAIAMALSLILPWGRCSDPAGPWPTIIYIGYVVLYLLGALALGPWSANLSAWAVFSVSLLAYLAVPLLGLANLFLAARGASATATYRVLLLVVIPASVWRATTTDSAIRGVGFWANLILVCVAGLYETIEAIRERRA